MEKSRDTSKLIYAFMLAFSAACIVASFFTGPVNTLFPGFFTILTSSQVLTMDACALGGLNGALLNTGLSGLISVLILKVFGKVQASGVSIGAFFLTVGFSFFGKNCLNMWPIALGVWLYAKFKKESFGKYAHFALFGAALAPFVSEMLFNRHLVIPFGLGLILAILVGAFIGFIMPAVSAHAATMHKGHDLFNAGLSAGLIGMVLFGIYKNVVLKRAGVEYALNSTVSDGFPVFFPVFLGCIFVASILVGAVMNKGFKGFGALLSRTGHSCDYTKLDSFPLMLINFGTLGLLSLAYFLAVGAKFTGPAVGALLCIVCWAGNGSHVRNVAPIMVGYAIVSLLSGTPLNTAGWVIGLCFATGLSPISGRWGLGWGVVAGALHACLVLNTAAFHGGFNIYNGGFTAGLVAMVLIPVLEACCKDIPTKKEQKQNIAA